MPSAMKNYDQSLDNTCEIVEENVDDNPFQMAKDCEDPNPLPSSRLNTTIDRQPAPPNTRFSVRKMNAIAEDFM